MPETEYSGFGGQYMPAEALATKVARASAGMVLAVLAQITYIEIQNVNIFFVIF